MTNQSRKCVLTTLWTLLLTAIGPSLLLAQLPLQKPSLERNGLIINSVGPIALAPDGKLLASGSVDGVIKLWDMATGKMVKSMPPTGRIITSLGFSPNGELLGILTQEK